MSSAGDACLQLQRREPEDATGMGGCGSFYSLELAMMGTRTVSLGSEDCLGRACAFDIFQVPEHVNLSTC